VSDPIVQIRGLECVRGTGPDAFSMAIDELTLAPGEHAACTGPSGCGKTTLLRLISGVLPPDRGTVIVGDQEITSLSDRERRALRATRIGMVFQHFALIDYLNAMDNILLPYRVSPALTLDRSVRDRARALAEQTGIGKLLGRRPDRLSQGERQRVAICRALVTRPSLLLCDEPTGNLDPSRSREAVGLILREADAAGATALVVTHDHSLLDGFHRVIDMPGLISPLAKSPQGASA
jgi:putative ABC transport system ATP-binding protein